MFYDEFMTTSNVAKGKIQFLNRNPFGYFIASILGGMYIGIGILLIFTIGGLLSGLPYAKVVMGISFGIALSLVIISGAELFTGNNLVMMAGLLKKKVSFLDCLKLWTVCYIGNWLGSILISCMFYMAGLSVDSVGQFIAESASIKMNIDIIALFFRAIICNILVCLATWSSYRCKSESGKLIMIFWCLFAFITSGYEHSIANMTLLTSGLLTPFSADISVFGYFYNIFIVTLGNMIGGILFIATPYYLITKR